MHTPEEIEASLEPKRSRWWIVLALILIGGGVIAAMVWSRGDEKEGPTWKTATATRGEIHLSASATGTLEPRGRVTIGAELSGLVQEVLVEENDVVEQGQALAKLDTTSLKNQREQARASVRGARASIKRAEASLQDARNKEALAKALVARGSSAQSSLDEAQVVRLRAEAELESARATLARERAALAAIETQLDKTVIRSPIHGVVLSRAVEPGNTVAASLQAPELFVLAEDLSEMELQVLISEADVSLVQPGQPANFTVDAYPQKTFAAEVASVSLSPTTSNNVVTYMTKLAVQNDDLLLRPGMTAATTIETGSLRDVLRVPNAALWFKPRARDEEGGFSFGRSRRKSSEVPKGSAVHILREGEPERIALEIGRSDEDFVEVLDGDLQEGDEVLVGEESRAPSTSADEDAQNNDRGEEEDS